MKENKEYRGNDCVILDPRICTIYFGVKCVKLGPMVW